MNVIELARFSLGPKNYQILVRHVRNAALDEAKQLFPQPYQEYFGREAQDAIEALKDKA